MRKQKLKCSYCGGTFFDAFGACISCGKTKREPVKPKGVNDGRKKYIRDM